MTLQTREKKPETHGESPQLQQNSTYPNIAPPRGAVDTLISFVVLTSSLFGIRNGAKSIGVEVSSNETITGLLAPKTTSPNFRK